MSAVLPPSTATFALSAALQHLWRAWTSLRRSELLWFVLLGLAYGLTQLGNLLELPADAPWLPALSRELLSPLLITLCLLPFWLPAARSAPEHPRRLWRLALGTLLGSFFAMLTLWWLVRALQWPSVGDLHRLAKGLPMHGEMRWTAYVGDSLSVFVPAFLGFVLFDLMERRERAAERLQQLLAAQSRLGRQAMAARLAALQAQVEPEFLFDSLVEIEQAYAAASPQAAARMERLIHHLRVALPRLREQGTTLAMEAELLASYLAVWQDRLGRPLSLLRDWSPALDNAAVPAMLLLPLLQGVLKRLGDAPLNCRLGVSPLPDAGQPGLRLQLQFDQPQLCGSEAEMQALRERASALCAGPARLDCRSDDARTVFTLECRP